MFDGPKTRPIPQGPYRLLICLFVLGVEAGLAQSLGEIARQERERRKNLPVPATHVYTNADLERSHILLPVDSSRFEANRKDAARILAPETITATSGSSKPSEIPLGDVARNYRLLKQLQEKQRADESGLLPGEPALALPPRTRPSDIPTSELDPKIPERNNLTRYYTRYKSVADGRIRLRTGDSLWKLAKQYLGRGAQWPKILAANPDLKDPDLIHIGRWIRLPQGESTSLMRRVRVRRGDSLWRIAQTEFGNGNAWSCIALANPAIPDAKLLRPGQLLAIPAHCAPAPSLRLAVRDGYAAAPAP